MSLAEDVSRKIAEAYLEPARQYRTWSGLPLEEVYRPADVANLDYERDLGDPGQYPHTRGVYANMYRGRLWSRRELCGYGSAEDTNQRLRYLIEQGESALNIAFDLPTSIGVDADHALAEDDVGLCGVPISSIEDMAVVIEGLPLDQVSFNLSTVHIPILLAIYVAAAERRGFRRAELRGTILNDVIANVFCGYRRSFAPSDIALRSAVDCIEFCVQEMPRWNLISVDGYNIRENGVNAAHEVAFCFALAREYLRAAVARGLEIDSIAPRVTFTNSLMMDFFEEVAKLRAARRIWARLMREEFGAQKPESLRYKFHGHTAGVSLARQQPLNNVVRVTIEAMAAVMAGCQSLHTCSYDELVGLPTEQAVEVALRTQQIIAMESGIAAVADPLGGSYFAEALTTALEQEILKVLGEIEAQGGMIAALSSGWIERLVRQEAFRVQREVESGERVIVGVNAYTKESDADEAIAVHRISSASVAGHMARLRRLREQRDEGLAQAALGEVQRVAAAGSGNLMPPMIAAAKAQATLGEINSAIRSGYGFDPDPLNQSNGLVGSCYETGRRPGC